jgi:conjugative transposon TraJ protein
MPHLAEAQLADRIRSLQDVLKDLYADMLPKCDQLIGVGRGIAGFAAMWYIGSRVWGHIARAEAIDFYPLFRPFVFGFAILNFSLFIRLCNGVLEPTVTWTSQMVDNSNAAVSKLLSMKQDAIKKTDYWQMYVGQGGNGDRERWYKYYYGEQPEGFFKSVGHNIQFAFAKFQYNFRNSIKQWMSEVLKVLFEAAALCINTIRVFYMIILAMLGPLVLGLSVFDGFQHTFTVWLARYINVFLWLPVANILGSILGTIQENMLKEDLKQIASNGDTFFSATDTGYLIFMIIGIISYFTVPSIANYIVNAGGGNTLLYKTTSMMTGTAMKGVYVVNSGAGMVADSFGDGHNRMSRSMASFDNTSGYFDTGNSGHLRDKIKGNS